MVKASEANLARYEELLDIVQGADRKLVFGSPTCLVGGNMFFGVHSTGLFVKLPPELGQALLAEGGSPSRRCPAVRWAGSTCCLRVTSGDWVRRSYEYAMSLPAKEDQALTLSRSGPSSPSRTSRSGSAMMSSSTT